MNKKGTIMILSGLLLIAAALCLTAYNFWDSSRAGNNAQEALELLLPEIPEPIPMPEPLSQDDDPDEIEYPDYVINPNMEMPVKTIDGIDYIGTLSIPALELELPVISQWSYPGLQVAPCRYVGSVYMDDLCICAHNFTRHFGNLKNLSIGDEVVYTDMDGNVFHYQVGEVTILDPTAIDEMVHSEWDLSLFTCTLGGRTRVTVRCEKIEE